VYDHSTLYDNQGNDSDTYDITTGTELRSGGIPTGSVNAALAGSSVVFAPSGTDGVFLTRY